MAFPTDLRDIKCQGFNQRILPAIADAIEREHVQWGDCRTFIDESYGQFVWKSCVWEISEIRETVYRICLLSGRLDDPDLTALVLRS
jgi:hypothetical protein